MKKIFILIILLASMMSTHAQDWKLFRTGEKYNYSLGSNAYYASIWVDSTAVIGNDSVYYFNKIIKKVKNGPVEYWRNLFLNDMSQFFLSGLAFHDNTTMVFKETETVKYLLKPLAQLNEQWVFDSLHNITATVVGAGIESLFGETDSVKLIVLSNADTIRISKNHSVLQFPLFNTSHQHVALTGIEGRNLGVQVPKFMDFFDFSINDVFCYSLDYGYSYHWWEKSYEKFTILSKTINSDTAIYHCRYLSVTYEEYLAELKVYYKVKPDSILVFINKADHFLNKYPNQILNSTIVGNKYKPIGVAIDASFNTVTKFYPASPFCKYGIPGSDTIYESGSPFYCSASLYGETYGVNRGVIDYCKILNITIPDYGYFTKLLTGGIFSGQQYGIIYNDSIFKGTLGVQDDAKVYKIYPNPVSELLTIEMNPVVETRALLYNSGGQVMADQEITTSKTHLDLRNLASGIYILRLISDHAVVVRKIIVE